MQQALVSLIRAKSNDPKYPQYIIGVEYAIEKAIDENPKGIAKASDVIDRLDQKYALCKKVNGKNTNYNKFTLGFEHGITLAKDEYNRQFKTIERFNAECG